MIQYRNPTVARKHEVAVHAVNGEVEGNSGLCCTQTLGDSGAAEDAAGARRVPQGTGVCVDVWTDVGEREEGEDRFDGGVVGEGFGRFY